MTNGPLPYTAKQLTALGHAAMYAFSKVERATKHDDADLSRAGVSGIDDYISRAQGALQDLARIAFEKGEASV